MKQPIRPKKIFLLSAFLAIILLPKVSLSQTFFGISNNPLDNATHAGTTATVTQPGSMVTNDLAILYVEYRGTGATLSVTTTGGQTWNLATTYSPAGSNQTISVFWCTYNGTWAASPVVSSGAGNTNGLTAVMYVFRPSVSSNVWGVNIVGTNANSATNPNTITGVTTTMPKTVTMAYWSSGAANTWGTLAGAGWTKPTFQTAATQVRNTTTVQSHTAAYNIQASAATTANVSQIQSAGTTALQSIISWNELSNDNCSGVTTLTSGTTCTNTAGNIVGATLSAGAPAPACGTPTYDVWYKFTAQTTNPTITLSSLGANFANPGIQLISGTCGGTLNNVSCVTGTSLTASGLTIGTSYFVRVYSTTAAPVTLGNFNICVTDPAPANDNCTGVVTLTSGTTCNNTSGNMVGATLSSGAPAPACGTPTYDVWYKFTAQATNPTITLSSLGANFTNAGIQIISGTCGGTLTNVSCATGSSITASGLTIGTSYFVRVYSTGTVPASSGTFNICITDPAPANDNCTGVVTLTSGTTCNNTLGNMIGATLSAGAPAPTCGTPTYDVWYKFTAQTTNPTVTISGNTNFTNPGIQLITGTCGGTLTNVSCATGTSLTASGLTIGTSYFVRIYSTGTVPTTSGTFNICVTDPAPANDNCTGVVTLTSSTTCNNTSGNMVGATLSSGAPAPTCGTPTYDVWYSFVAQSTNPKVTLSSLGANFTNQGIQLLSGTCGGTLNNVSCVTGSALTASGLTIGTTYFVRVYSTGTVPASAGSFNICVTDQAPANDNCTGVVTLTSAATCSNTQGNMVGATLSAGAPAPTCGTPTYDVWYKFTAQTTNPTITISGNTNFTNPGIQLITGTCGGTLTNVSCVSGTSLTASGLTIGTSYFVRIYSTGTVPTTNGTFNICITDPAPANDDCVGAVTLTPGTTCVNTSGNVISATLSSGVPLPTCGTPVYDVWYSFVAQSTVQTVTLSSLGANFINQGIQVFSGNCGSLITIGCSASSAVTVSGLGIGTTYFVRVYSTSAAPTSSGTFNICITNVPANDDCSNAVALTSSTSCVNTAGTLVNATNVALASTCAASSGTRTDVWYSFTAQTTNPTITIGSGPSNSRYQIFSGGCGVLNSVFCSTSASQAASGLTVGTNYLVRVYSNTGASGTFTICIVDPAPSNNACSGAVTLTSNTTCITTTGNIYASTNEAPTITADCAGTVVYDVWYKFVAQITNPTISLSNFGSDFTNPAMELLSGGCGSQTALFCGTTSIDANFLTPGTTYYVRVYSSSGTAPTSSANANFDICIVDPVATPPFNDDCANAINVPIWNTCNNVTGNMAGATLSSGLSLSSPCTGTVAYDVWYKFIAVTNNAATITISSLGTNFTSSGIQIFSGTCGSLTAIACNNGTTVTTPALTTNSVYYVRVFSTTGPAPNGNARFNICATTTNAPVRSGNSYVNISKKTTGGVIEPGDTLEIRFTVNHTSGIMTNLRFVDNVPTKTSMLSTTNDSIRIITNEGLTYKKYTVAGGDDAGTYKASPAAGEYNIRLNVGFSSGSAPNAPTVMTNASTSANGQMSSSDNPRGGGGLLFAIAYRVKVTGAVGDSVTLFPGQFIYNNGTTDVTLTATAFKMLITDPLNLCSNSIGLNNAVENGGTFGSGSTLNRSTDLTTPIAGYTFVPEVNAYNSVGDGRYAIVKNISPQSGTQRNARRQPNCNVSPTLAPTDSYSCSNRMFGGHWDIDGDHSGTSNSTGNTPPDADTPGGYMLEVNADYVASEVYRQTISNLCPNTYYEFSAWVRNICHTCGIDSLGHQFASSTIPADQPGYPGVLPNLTFTLNNLDYYNTGEIDTVGWIKKGFVFKTDTGTAGTTATFSIRNNAQGGGGNDWALDDIAIATCLPTMQYSPSINPNVCEGNSLAIYDTVRSYFNNYKTFKWQRSTDGGNNWTNITASTDTSVTHIGSTYQFITKYTVPSSRTTLANSNDLYRVVVATSSSNLLNASCGYTDASTIITLTVFDCGPPLSIDLLSFSGKNNNGNADLMWVTSKENEPVSYNVEKSIDGTKFTSIATIKGHGNNSENNYYQYTDPTLISGKVWYRLAIVNKDGRKKYSQIVLLSDKTIDFNFNSVVNPFNHELDFEISSPQNSRIEAVLINLSGKPVRKENFNVYQGMNSLVISNTDNLPAGMYVLQVRDNDKIISKKLIKK